MSVRDSEFVKGGDDVKLSIDSSVAQGIERFADKRQWVSVLDGDVVQSSVVLADSHASARFGGEEEWCCASRSGSADESFVQIFVEPLTYDA